MGTLCFYIAVKHTSAANVSQYHYTQLITGTVVTYAIWHTRPGVPVLLGAVLIFASGVYIAVGARGQGPGVRDQLDRAALDGGVRSRDL